MRRGAVIFRNAASTLNAVILPVRGFSDGILRISMLNEAESDSTSMRWVLRSRCGSAQISSVVRSGPMRIFNGSPRDAAVGFPANLNVAVALSLAGIGPDRTTLEIWADPHLDRNTHRIEVESDSASFSMEIRNVPSDNPRTGRITALSVIAALRKLTAPLRIGT